MEGHGVSTSGDRKRPFQFPLLASAIVIAGFIAVVNEVMKGGQLARSIAVPLPMAMEGVPVTESKSSSLPLADFQSVRQEAEAGTESRQQQQQQPKEEQEQDTKTDKPLNIVLLYGDDWRHDSIGAAKASIVKTPFFDWLATQGIRFAHNCVTTSVCWISRATLYTGLYVSRHKSDYPHKPLWYEGWNQSWPQLLKNSGYHLGHTGKWHFPVEPRLHRAFDYLNTYYGAHWYDEREGKIHSTKKDEKGALEFLKGRPHDKPFMLSVCFFAPHSVDGTDEQYFPQEETMLLYQNETVEVPVSATEEAWKKMPHFFGDINEGRRRYGIRFDTPEKHQSMMKNYFRLISEIDQTSRVIYKELEAQGVLDNTMIILTTDNGLYHAEHQLAGKWFPHQESIRVPLIIKDPRMPKKDVGTINDDFTLNIDLASTILAAAGIKQPDVMQGRNIADLYLTSDPKWREEFFYEHPVHLSKEIIPASTALVRKNFKFMTWPDYNVEQLFNLESDPYELEDIINEADHQDMITEMRQRHDELQKAALEPGPIDENGEKMRGSTTSG